MRLHSAVATKRNLKVHKQGEHVGIQSKCKGINFECDQCEHKARHKGSLRSHKHRNMRVAIIAVTSVTTKHASKP